MAEARRAAGLPLVNTEIPLVGQWHVKKCFNPRRALALFLRFFSIRSTIKQLNCSARLNETRTCSGTRCFVFERYRPWHVQAPFLGASRQYRRVSCIAKRLQSLESKRNDNRAAITTCSECESTMASLRSKSRPYGVQLDFIENNRILRISVR